MPTRILKECDFFLMTMNDIDKAMLVFDDTNQINNLITN